MASPMYQAVLDNRTMQLKASVTSDRVIRTLIAFEHNRNNHSIPAGYKSAFRCLGCNLDAAFRLFPPHGNTALSAANPTWQHYKRNRVLTLHHLGVEASASRVYGRNWATITMSPQITAAN